MTKDKLHAEVIEMQAKNGGTYLEAVNTIKDREVQAAHECVSAKAARRRMDNAAIADELADEETLRMEQRHGIGPRSDRSHDSTDYGDAPSGFTFSMSVQMGNEGMSTRAQLVDAVGRVAQYLEDEETDGKVFDSNGNTVGHWSVGYPEGA